jgi:hypothetical protein
MIFDKIVVKLKFSFYNFKKIDMIENEGDDNFILNLSRFIRITY